MDAAMPRLSEDMNKYTGDDMLLALTTDGCAALEDLRHAGVHGDHEILLVLDFDVPLLYHQFDPVAEVLLTKRIDYIADILLGQLQYLQVMVGSVRQPQEGPGRVLVQPLQDLLHCQLFIMG